MTQNDYLRCLCLHIEKPNYMERTGSRNRRVPLIQWRLASEMCSTGIFYNLLFRIIFSDNLRDKSLVSRFCPETYKILLAVTKIEHRAIGGKTGGLLRNLVNYLPISMSSFAQFSPSIFVYIIFSYCLLFSALRGNMLIPKQRRSNRAKKEATQSG